MTLRTTHQYLKLALSRCQRGPVHLYQLSECDHVTLMLLSMSPCVASGRSSERTLGARLGSGASLRAPSDAAPTDAAPTEPSRPVTTAK